MRKTISKTLLSVIIISAVIALDQYVKLWVVEYFQSHHIRLLEICSIFNLTIVFNKGISFGMFNQWAYNNYIFLVLASVVTLFVVYLLIEARGLLIQISYSLIIGGAVGNIIDRYNSGAVLDFIELHWQQVYFPAFNIADSAICAGAALLLYDMIVNDLNKKKKK